MEFKDYKIINKLLLISSKLNDLSLSTVFYFIFLLCKSVKLMLIEIKSCDHDCQVHVIEMCLYFRY